ncbi:MAG: 1-deoxy-D-xylulose-5-phosphate reductoisomerase [Candidatus Eisenbacteria bacterium]|nr:1-deoxy-D-xylulose-5-phosphate reductoisomerase [Candidatus Eisenbacteria bacterium]
MLKLAILGSTGSIGRQALEVAARESGRVTVTALAAGSRLDALEAQARPLRPSGLALERAADSAAARSRLASASPGATIHIGPGAAARLAAECDAGVVLNGIVGAAGLEASLRTLERGARLALANKETLVVGGPLVRARLERGGELIPVDSEHSAALQCLNGRPAGEVRRMTLTASGGALRNHRDWRCATPAEVLRHPVWEMGERITVDSALLTNKAFELIEARWLFDLEWSQLDAWLHPEALVHALVTFTDGSTVMQAAPADMKLPIQLSLSWPARWGEVVPALQARALSSLSFEPLLEGRFPAFDLALSAGRAGGTAPCVLNAADEVAVAAFLEGRITLGQVPEIVERVLNRHEPERVESFEQLRDLDAWAREAARGVRVGA